MMEATDKPGPDKIRDKVETFYRSDRGEIMEQVEDPGLTSGQIASFKAVFYLYDEYGDGTVHVDDLGTIMRLAGENPTETEVETIKQTFTTDGNEKLGLDEFLKLMSKRVTQHGDEEVEERLLASFRALDKRDTGMIDRAELRHMLTSQGERMTQEDVDDLLNEVDMYGEGQLDYMEVTKMLLNDKLDIC